MPSKWDMWDRMGQQRIGGCSERLEGGEPDLSARKRAIEKPATAKSTADFLINISLDQGRQVRDRKWFLHYIVTAGLFCPVLIEVTVGGECNDRHLA